MIEHLHLKEMKQVFKRSLPRISLAALLLTSASCIPVVTKVGEWSATYCSQSDCPKGYDEAHFNGDFSLGDKDLTCPKSYTDTYISAIWHSSPVFISRQRNWYLKPDTCKVTIYPQSKNLP